MSIQNNLQLQFHLQLFKGYTKSSEATKADFAQRYRLKYGSYQKSDYTHVFLTLRASDLLSRLFFLSPTVSEILAFLCFPTSKTFINQPSLRQLNALICLLKFFTDCDVAMGAIIIIRSVTSQIFSQLLLEINARYYSILEISNLRMHAYTHTHTQHTYTHERTHARMHVRTHTHKHIHTDINII